jgi:hypothetical protein
MTESLSSLPADASIDEEALLCPSCGYDLRATAGDRCTECGDAFNRDDLRISRIPWAHRREIGRIKAYIKTVWLITIGSKSLKHEAAKPQNLRDAIVFRRIAAILVGIVFVAGFIAVMKSHDGLELLAVQPRNPFFQGGQSRWMDDFLVPWSAGVTNWVVLPLMLLFFAFHITGVQRQLFKLKSGSPRRRESAEAMAYYAIAPLAWVLPCGMIGLVFRYFHVEPQHIAIFAFVTSLTVIATCLCGVLIAGKATVRLVGCAITFSVFAHLIMMYEGSDIQLPGIAIGFLMVAIISILSTYLRVAQWSARARHSGFERVLVDVPYLFGLWFFGAIVFFGFLPWCIGFVWIVIDSFL